MLNKLPLIAFMLANTGVFAQGGTFIGAGNSNGVTVTSSSTYKAYPGYLDANADNTLDGEGLIGAKVEAARFLSQAGFGGSVADVDNLVKIGQDKWLAQQFSLPATLLADTAKAFYDQGLANYISNGGDSSGYPYRVDDRHVDYAWWNNTMNAEDQLRQRTAYALSQILVISSEGTLGNYGTGVSLYYDILLKNAFGNFRDILKDVTLSVAMGSYLSHLNNPKADLANNIHPDENYAREIMQLFTIGLYKLNINGSQQLDGSGNPIPTYDNDDIKELAKVFTGLGVASRLDSGNLYFYLGLWQADFSVPMKMYEEQHEIAQKTLLDGFVIPPGQAGMEDIDMAIDHLFNHPNVGPFIARRLIQQFVKSNPSPNYIQTVAEKFNDNGTGVRGDMKAVIMAILTHPEARTCDGINGADQGKLKEPILRYTQFARLFLGETPHGKNRFWNYAYLALESVNQAPLHSQTVFNFYGPDFTPNGAIGDANMVGPEFEIHNTRTAIGYTDMVYYWVELNLLFISFTSDALDSHYTPSDLTSLYDLVKDTDAFLDHLDVYLCNGQLSAHTRSVIKNKFEEYSGSLTDLDSKIKLALYIVMVSPDFVVLK
ncbi:MAG: DUF1800 family protein [Crocinitomicaceae bacterium]